MIRMYSVFGKPNAIHSAVEYSSITFAQNRGTYVELVLKSGD